MKNRLNNEIKYEDKYDKFGFIIINLFSPKLIDQLKLELEKKIIKKTNNENLYKKNNNFLKNFHKYKFTDKEKKKNFEPSNRFIKLKSKFLKKIKNNYIIQNILIKNWKHRQYKIKWVASLKKKQIKDNVCGFRICEPKTKGVGAHLDLHVGGKILNDLNVLKSLWIPLEGFDKKYTLNISPKSHIVNHPVKKFIKQKKFISNVFQKKYVKKFKFKRFSLKKGDAILFHPNLLHGGTNNKGINSRVSLEIRLYNKKNIFKWLPNK